MWKTGKRGTQRGEESWKEKTGDGRREMIEAEEKNGAKERKGMRQAKEGERQERRRENRVGGNKIIAAWLRRCGIK